MGLAFRAAADALPARPGAELLLLLALLWMALTAYALAARPLTVFGYALKQAEIVELFRPAPAPDHVLEASTDGASRQAEPDSRGSEGPAAPRSVDEAPQRILILGDSMIEGLLPRLTDYAVENGHSVNAVIWYGSRTIDWAKGTRLREMLSAYEPSFVLIALGSSELRARGVEKRAVGVARMLELIGPRKVVWIGPPNWTADTGINALLARLLGDGRFFRSAEMRFERKKDGIHPTLAASEHWMDAVARFIVEKSAVSIRLAPPVTTGRPRPRVRVFPPPS